MIFFIASTVMYLAMICNNLNAQIDISLNSDCECYTFIDACGGQELDLTNSDTKHYVLRGGEPWCKEITLDRDGRFCPGNLISGYLQQQTSISSGNFEVNDTSRCTIQLFQTLPTTGKINGQNFRGLRTPGNGDILTYYGLSEHEVELNSVNSPDIKLCPSDELTLSIPGLSFGYPDRCLKVDVFDLDGNLLAFDSTRTTSNDINLTPIINDLPAGGPYVLKYGFCCDSSSNNNCSVSTTKHIYISAENNLSYDSYVTVGFAPNTSTVVPATSPPGTQMTGGVDTFDLLFNQFKFTFYNVEYNSSSELSYTLVDRNCDTGNQGNIIIPETTVNISNMFIIGPFSMTVPDNIDCQCYRLDISYDDGCDSGTVTDSYYFQEGKDCSVMTLQDNDLVYKISDAEDKIAIVQNPIMNDLILDISPSLINSNGVLVIQNSKGQTVIHQNIELSSTKTSVPFNELVSGFYLYFIEVNGKIYSDKVIKL